MPKSKRKVRLNPTKDCAEQLQKQTEFHYMNFDRRRSYEWKFSLALWTAIAAFIALSLQSESSIPATCPVILWEFLICFVILGLQFYFLHNVFKANALDKEKSWYYEAALNKLMRTDYETQEDPHSQALNAKIASFRDRAAWFAGYWTCIVHLGITVLLLLTAFMVLHAKPRFTKSRRPSSPCCATRTNVQPLHRPPLEANPISVEPSPQNIPKSSFGGWVHERI